MATSQNGYTVIERDDCKFYKIAGIDLPLRPDDCGYVLAHFARHFNREVEALGATETFGHALRQISGSNDWSNHASGTALDLNASQHPQGKTGTFAPMEQAALDLLVKQYDEVVRWGGTFRTTKDEMHFEIDKDYADVRRLAKVLRRDGVVSLVRLVPGKSNLDVYMVKRELKHHGYFSGEMNNKFTSEMRESYKALQRALGFEDADADGIPGPASLQYLGLTAKEV